MMSGYDDLIKSMREFGFTLSGSRKIAEKYPKEMAINESTDWDFVCANEYKFKEFLSINGFALKNVSFDYRDKNSAAVYEHEKYNIECVIKLSMHVHHAIFDNMNASFYKRNIWKSNGVDRNDIRENINGMIDMVEKMRSMCRKKEIFGD